MSHERLPVTGADLDDLDLATLESYVRRRAPGLVEAGSLEEAGIRLGLLAKQAPRVVPTAVGLLVFGRMPQLVMPDWGVAAVAVQGSTLADPLGARLDLEGNLAGLVTQALAFVREQAGGRGASLPDGAEEYPEAAVRETVVNALVHRDLRRTGRVAVRLFLDRLEVWSPGGPRMFVRTTAGFGERPKRPAKTNEATAAAIAAAATAQGIQDARPRLSADAAQSPAQEGYVDDEP